MRGIQVEAIDKAIVEVGNQYGYFALLSNEINDPVAALELYHTRDVVKKVFGNLKEHRNCRRTLVSSDQSLDGKLFVEFIDLIYLSNIKKRMEEKNFFQSTRCRVCLTSLMSSNVLLSLERL